MKKEYLETSLLILFVYFGWKFQLTSARHAHPHRSLNLEDCHRCAPGYGVVRQCTRHRDTECGACAAGHYSSHHSARRPCYPCSRCGVGLYVAHRCTALKDTVCDSCHTYKGPHNQDFYDRCKKPLESSNSTSHQHMAQKSVDLTRGVPNSIVIFSGIAMGVLVIAIAAAGYVVSRRRHFKRVDPRYEAVATQEAVML